MAAHVLVVATVTAAVGRPAGRPPASARAAARSTFTLPDARSGHRPARAAARRAAAARRRWSAGARPGSRPTASSATPTRSRRCTRSGTRGASTRSIVSTLPGQSSRWLRSTSRTASPRSPGVSVTHVVAMDMRPRRAARPPAPVHERSPLGPLGVLAWGGTRRVDEPVLPALVRGRAQHRLAVREAEPFTARALGPGSSRWPEPAHPGAAAAPRSSRSPSPCSFWRRRHRLPRVVATGARRGRPPHRGAS